MTCRLPASSFETAAFLATSSYTLPTWIQQIKRLGEKATQILHRTGFADGAIGELILTYTGGFPGAPQPGEIADIAIQRMGGS